MRKKDSDSFSTTSGTSKNSGEKGKKTPRFSLRNLFYRRHSSRKSSRSLSSNSNAEAEVRSVQSLQVPPSIEKEASSSGLSFEEAGAGSRLSRDSSECPLCLVMQPKENFPSVMTCHHRSCRDCLKQYLRIEITESRINIACPECAEKFHPNDIEAILGEPQLLKKYEMFMLRRVLVLDPDARWCPAPDCRLVCSFTICNLFSHKMHQNCKFCQIITRGQNKNKLVSDFPAGLVQMLPVRNCFFKFFLKQIFLHVKRLTEYFLKIVRQSVNIQC